MNEASSSFEFDDVLRLYDAWRGAAPDMPTSRKEFLESIVGHQRFGSCNDECIRKLFNWLIAWDRPDGVNIDPRSEIANRPLAFATLFSLRSGPYGSTRPNAAYRPLFLRAPAYVSRFRPEWPQIRDALHRIDGPTDGISLIGGARGSGKSELIRRMEAEVKRGPEKDGGGYLPLIARFDVGIAEDDDNARKLTLDIIETVARQAMRLATDIIPARTSPGGRSLGIASVGWCLVLSLCHAMLYAARWCSINLSLFVVVAMIGIALLGSAIWLAVGTCVDCEFPMSFIAALSAVTDAPSSFALAGLRGHLIGLTGGLLIGGIIAGWVYGWNKRRLQQTASASDGKSQPGSPVAVKREVYRLVANATVAILWLAFLVLHQFGFISILGIQKSSAAPSTVLGWLSLGLALTLPIWLFATNIPRHFLALDHARSVLSHLRDRRAQSGPNHGIWSAVRVVLPEREEREYARNSAAFLHSELEEALRVFSWAFGRVILFIDDVDILPSSNYNDLLRLLRCGNKVKYVTVYMTVPTIFWHAYCGPQRNDINSSVREFWLLGDSTLFKIAGEWNDQPSSGGRAIPLHDTVNRLTAPDAQHREPMNANDEVEPVSSFVALASQIVVNLPPAETKKIVTGSQGDETTLVLYTEEETLRFRVLEHLLRVMRQRCIFSIASSEDVDISDVLSPERRVELGLGVTRRRPLSVQAWVLLLLIGYGRDDLVSRVIGHGTSLREWVRYLELAIQHEMFFQVIRPDPPEQEQSEGDAPRDHEAADSRGRAPETAQQRTQFLETGSLSNSAVWAYSTKRYGLSEARYLSTCQPCETEWLTLRESAHGEINIDVSRVMVANSHRIRTAQTQEEWNQCYRRVLELDWNSENILDLNSVRISSAEAKTKANAPRNGAGQE